MRIVQEVMSRDVEVIRPDAPLEQAAQKMKRLDVGSLPVCDGDRLVGMITDRDITIRATAEGRDPSRTPVQEMMTPQVIYCFDGDNVAHAVRLMEDHKVRRLPVVNRDRRLVGIIVLGDIAVDALHEEHAEEEEIAAVAFSHISEPTERVR